MHPDLLAAIEADINRVSQQQQQAPQDVQLATKKMQLKDLAFQFLHLQNQYKKLSEDFA